MEIFIVGALVVALMVYISTRVKRSAAEAFEPETVEREDFTINKPEGFMTPIQSKPEFAFEAYSRDFGEKKARNVWQARALLTVADAQSTFADECARAKNSADKIASEKISENDAGERICLLETERIEDDVRTIDFRKIVESRSRQKIYNLRVLVLPPFRADYIERVDEMMNSFHLK